MKRKRNAPVPKATGTPPGNPTLESLAEQLRVMNVDPAYVLFAALEGEKIARREPSGDRLRSLRSLEEEQAKFRTPEEERERLHSLEEKHRSLLGEQAKFLGEGFNQDAAPELRSAEEVNRLLLAVQACRPPAFEERLRYLEEALAMQRRKYERAEEIRQEIASLKAVDALRADPGSLYAPSVLGAIAEAALRCRMPNFEGRTGRLDGLEGLFLTEVHVDPPKRPKAFLFEVYKALVLTELPAVKGAKRLLKATNALRLARAVDVEADRIAEARYLEVPASTIALRRVAKENGTTATALRKAIERARRTFPGDDWPKKKARRL